MDMTTVLKMTRDL